MDEVITFVLLDPDGTEMSEEFDTELEAWAALDQEWDVPGGSASLTIMKKTYVFASYELVGPSDAKGLAGIYGATADHVTRARHEEGQ